MEFNPKGLKSAVPVTPLTDLGAFALPLPQPAEPFTQEGVYDDEITLELGKQSLYVPKNFLTVASPVFEAMFKHNFKENKEKRVQMTGKSYDDCLEFLKCINPRILKEVDGEEIRKYFNLDDLEEKNVLRIAPFAEEYQVTAIVTKCEDVMMSMLSEAQDKAKSAGERAHHLKPLRKCLNVLKSAISLGYTDISDMSVKAIIRFGYYLYNDKPYSERIFGCNQDEKICRNIFSANEGTYGDVRNECISLFKSLDPGWQNKILSSRLNIINDCNFK